MKKKMVSGVLLTLLSIGILTFSFSIQPVKASGTIYIRADGSVEGTTDISTVDNVTYTFTNNISDSIVVERSNVTIDGNGYTLQGSGIGNGFSLSGIHNVTIQKTNISGFLRGISLDLSSNNNTICSNIITNNTRYGVILLDSSSKNSISGNNITNNGWDGVYVDESSGNLISRNNITYNNRNGVFFDKLSSSIVSGNNITNSNSYGIQLDESSNVTVSGNYINANNYGFYLDGSSNVTLRNNTIADSDHYNFGVVGSPLSEFIHDMDESNTVNGKPIYYWVNHRDMKVPSDAGYVALINSTNITVEGTELKNNGQGILLAYTTNSQVTNNNITNNGYGVRPTWSSHITFCRNDISNNFRGIWLSWSTSNIFSGNNVTHNEEGIGFYASSGSRMYHNNFIKNTWHVSPYSIGSSNFWDDGYPSGGNYWSDYTGVDLSSGPYQNETGSDGIADTPYEIPADNEDDDFPLMGPFSFFNAGTWGETTYHVDTVSNSTVADFAFSESEKLISFNVTGTDGTVGFCRVNIPNILLGGPYVVLINDAPPLTINELTNGTHTLIYFTYIHSTKTVEITGTTVVPEFSSWMSVLLVFIIFAVATVIYKRRLLKTRTH